MAKKYLGMVKIQGRLYHPFRMLRTVPWVPGGVFTGAPSGNGWDVTGSPAFVGSVEPKPLLSSALTDVAGYIRSGTGIGDTFATLSHEGSSPESFDATVGEGPASWIPLGLGSGVPIAKGAYNEGVTRVTGLVMANKAPGVTTFRVPGFNTNGRFDKELGVTGDNSAVVVRTVGAEPKLRAIFARVRDGLGSVEFELPKSQPTAFTMNGSNHVVHNSQIRAWVEGKDAVDFDVPTHVYLEDGVIFASFDAPGEDAGPDGAAYAARAAYEDKLHKAITAKSAGRDPAAIEWPSPVRPPATQDPGLTDTTREFMDKWWDSMQSLTSLAKSRPGPTEDEAFEKYVKGGGTKTKPEWLAAVDTALNEPVEKGGENSDILDTVAKALGYAGKKTLDGLSWLGDSALDLMKSWGPAGTVGAYAGIKATEEASKKDWLPIIAVGFGVILLLR